MNPTERKAGKQLQPLFDMEIVFDVDDYFYFYRDELSDARSEAEIDVLVELLELSSPMRILDLACGFGRHANRLAALGHSVVGVDLSPGFLEVARKGAMDLGVQVDYRQGDMRQTRFAEEFDRVVSLFTSFGYFEHGENKLVLENIVRALKPSGLLVLEVRNRDSAAKCFPACDVVERDGNLQINRRFFDPLTGRLLNRRIVIRNGIRKDKPYFVRLYNATEVRDMLDKAGAEVCQVVDYSRQPISAESHEMVVIARKLLS